ncbi:MAG: hypothetical protein AAB316_10270 [Bacteroidota bacterium]
MKINPTSILILALILLQSCDLEQVDPVTNNPGGGGSKCDPTSDTITFQTTFGGGTLDSATAVALSPDTSIFITGFTKKQGEDLLVYQTNLCQDTLGYRSLGGGTNKYIGSAIVPSGDGGYVVAGTKFSFIGDASYVTKLNSQGISSSVWTQTAEKGIHINDVVRMANGDYLVGGGIIIEGSFGDQSDAYLVVLGSNLAVKKAIQFPGNSFGDEVFDVLELDNGEVVGVGSAWIGFGNRIKFVRANPSSGNILEDKTLTYKGIGGDNNVNGDAALKTSDGNIAVAGHYQLIFGSDPTTTFLMKINPTGSVFWENEYGDVSQNIVGDHEPAAVIETSDGGFLIAGNHKLDGVSDIFLLKTDANGDYEWDKSYGGSGKDVANDVVEMPDGGFLVVGYTESFNTAGETGKVYLLKTDAQGIVK